MHAQPVRDRVEFWQRSSAWQADHIQQIDQQNTTDRKSIWHARMRIVIALLDINRMEKRKWVAWYQLFFKERYLFPARVGVTSESQHKFLGRTLESLKLRLSHLPGVQYCCNLGSPPLSAGWYVSSDRVWAARRRSRYTARNGSVAARRAAAHLAVRASLSRRWRNAGRNSRAAELRIGWISHRAWNPWKIRLPPTHWLVIL